MPSVRQPLSIKFACSAGRKNIRSNSSLVMNKPDRLEKFILNGHLRLCSSSNIRKDNPAGLMFCVGSLGVRVIPVPRLAFDTETPFLCRGRSLFSGSLFGDFRLLGFPALFGFGKPDFRFHRALPHCMKRPISDFLLIYANVSRIPLIIFVSNLLNSAHKWKYRLSLSFLFRLLKHL